MKTFTRTLITAAVLAGFAVNAAPLDVTISITELVENLGGDTRRVTQTLSVIEPNDPETNADGITFDFKKAGEFFPSSTITDVTVTVGYTLNDIELTLENNSAGTAGGSVGDRSESTNVWDTFSIGAITSDGLSQITTADFAGTMLTLDLSAGVLSGQTATEGPTDYTNTEVRNVSSAFFGDYAGSGTFNSTIDSTIGIFSNVTGANIDNSQNVGDDEFFMQVEYIVVPKPGTLAMAGIAFLSFGGLMIARRRKN